MARASPRISFNDSPFIRLLSALAVADVEAPRQPFAERLGLWLDWTAAIPLSAALHASAAVPALVPDAASTAPAGHAAATATATATAAAQAIARVRAELAQAISTDTMLTAPVPGGRPAEPNADQAKNTDADFLPYRRCYQAHQRLMQARIGPLRAQVRETLVGQSAALGKLAALDAVLDQALAARERSLLATVPSLLAARFARLQRAHLAAQTKNLRDENPSPSPFPAQPPLPQPDTWLALFGIEMQNLLLAEMDLRLQPAWGLVEALSPEVATQT